MTTEKVLGRASLGVFLLRYGSYFPYSSLMIQSLKTSHYILLERNIDELKAFVQEIKDGLSAHLGEEVSASNIRRLFAGENRQETGRIMLESINLDRLERVCSSLYVTIVTCMAAGLSEHAAKLGLGLNVSSVISHTLFKLIGPAIPRTQPLLRFFTRAACASVGIISAFRLEKSLLVWANCLLGAELLISAFEMLIGIKRCESIDSEQLAVDTSVTARMRTTCIWILAGSSMFVQYSPGNDMPVWLKGVLIGPRMFEYGLQTLSVSMKDIVMNKLLVRALSTAPIEATRLAQIIVNSDKVPIGKITDHFDEQVKDFFKQSANKRSLVNGLLNDSLLDKERLRVPSKIRENILSSVLEEFASLSPAEIQNIPVLIRKLPQTMMSSDQEDALFEKFLARLSTDLIDSLSVAMLEKVFTNVARLHIKHPCKDEPIVRLFEALASACVSSQTAVNILTVNASIVPKPKLSHPFVRKALVSMIQRVDKNHKFHILKSVAHLPVFPEADDLLDLGVLPSSPDQLVDGCIGLLGIRGGEKIWNSISAQISKEIIVSILEKIGDVPRINSKVGLLMIGKIGEGELVMGSPRALAGYCRIVSQNADDVMMIEKTTTWMTTALRGLEEGSLDLGTALWLSRGVGESERISFFNTHVHPQLGDLTPNNVRACSRVDWLEERLVKHVESIVNPLAVAALLRETDSGPVADHLCKLIHKHQKEEKLLTKIWTVLTANGVEIPPSNSARKRALKEVTRTVFRTVRMAPVPIE